MAAALAAESLKPELAVAIGSALKLVWFLYDYNWTSASINESLELLQKTMTPERSTKLPELARVMS